MKTYRIAIAAALAVVVFALYHAAPQPSALGTADLVGLARAAGSYERGICAAKFDQPYTCDLVCDRGRDDCFQLGLVCECAQGVEYGCEDWTEACPGLRWVEQDNDCTYDVTACQLLTGYDWVTDWRWDCMYTIP